MLKKTSLKDKRLLEKIDILGTTASLLCIVHCGVIPVLLTLGTIGVSAEGTDHKIFDLILIGLGLLLGFIAFYSGYKLHHSRTLPLGFFFLGFIAFIIGYFEYFNGLSEFFISTGSFLLIVAHFYNWRYCKNWS